MGNPKWRLMNKFLKKNFPYFTGRQQATPFSAFLRTPLSWYQSTTYSFFKDESHASIRRTYISPSHPGSKRQFCGYCGTTLSYWTEDPASEAEFICVTLCSLVGEDLRAVEDLGLLPQGDVQDSHEQQQQQQQQQKKRKKNDEDATMQDGRTGDLGEQNDTGRDDDGNGSGLPWLENMIRGSQLGRISRRRHHPHHRHLLTDDRVQVEWEVVDWTDGHHHHHLSSDDNPAVSGGVVVGDASASAGDASTKRSIDLVDRHEAEMGKGSSAATKGEDVEMK